MGKRSQKKLKQKHLSFRESMEAYDNKPWTPQALRKIEVDRQKEALDRDREEARRQEVIRKDIERTAMMTAKAEKDAAAFKELQKMATNVEGQAELPDRNQSDQAQTIDNTPRTISCEPGGEEPDQNEYIVQTTKGPRDLADLSGVQI